MQDCPCKNCKERYVSCHSACDKYKAWRNDFDEKKNKEFKNKMIYNSLITYERSARERVYKRYNQKGK